MNLKQYKEAWEEFAKWLWFFDKGLGKPLNKELPKDIQIVLDAAEWFLLNSFPLQLGVYLKHLDENNIHLDVSWTCVYHNDEKEGFRIINWQYSLHEFGYCVDDEIGDFNTMNEAWEEALEQAFKIRNKQLK